MSNPGGVDESPRFSLRLIAPILGENVASLIEVIATQAQESGLPLYLAGGVVRDLMLGQQNLDLDFVIEGDAIGFATSMARSFGGSVQEHKPFGTAKWMLDGAAADKLSLVADDIPPQVDFASARSETYAHPAALPTVSPSDMRSDLQRRDFSVNALAIQLSPAEQSGAVLDGSGGCEDLKLGLICALHENSFVDDPTRILRAARYALRLDFDLEQNTAQWMRAALPLLARVSGKRLQNELSLILREGRAGEMLLWLQDLGALAQIQPAFRVSSRLPALIARCNEARPPWQSAELNRQALRWIAIFTSIHADAARSLCERLALRNSLTESILAIARLAVTLCKLDDRLRRPSQLAAILDELPETALQAAWLLCADKPQTQEWIAAYASDWRRRAPATSGNELKAMGIAAGPQYRRILDRLRRAWIDGEVRTVEEEQALLRQVLDACE
jgi:tRNA nucleotidyltransferase (CCA-adding enzyme)